VSSFLTAHQHIIGYSVPEMVTKRWQLHEPLSSNNQVQNFRVTIFLNPKTASI